MHVSSIRESQRDTLVPDSRHSGLLKSESGMLKMVMSDGNFHFENFYPPSLSNEKPVRKTLQKENALPFFANPRTSTLFSKKRPPGHYL